MGVIKLDGEWKLTYFPQGVHAVAGPRDLASVEEPAIPAAVPGNVELDLQRAGVIPEPYYGTNIRQLRPYEFYEWWYEREFDAPASMAGLDWELVFAGLDTFATVWVNGVEVGRSANMLIEHRFDISAAIQPGQTNRICVRIESAVQRAREYRYDAMLSALDTREEGLFIRKAPHMWGWDIFPRVVTAGIWRSVWIEEREPNAFEQLYYWTAGINRDGANLGVRFQFRTTVRELNGFALRFSGVCGEHRFEQTIPVEFIAGGCGLWIPGARLWWPKGYGGQHLYTITAQVLHHGEILAEQVDRIGVRTLAVDRTEQAGPVWQPGPKPGDAARYDEPEAPDAHFIFRVNGEPIMVKGTNWVALDAFHSRDAGRLNAAMDLLEDLGCNMVRSWGGNVYEDHAFFDLCDERGVLVWQDFAYGCGRYPQTEAFLSEVRREAEAVVCKLRNHASLALWCGDNENDAGYTWGGLSPEYNRLTREVLPRVVHRCDPFRHFVPSSPYLPPKAASAPEEHLWGPRGYYKSPYYTSHRAHFIGEIGYHGCPNVSSIRRFISPESLWPWENNEEWRVHETYHLHHWEFERNRIKLMANQIREVFGMIPEELESFALASQIVQAEAKKFFIESTRLRKWRTSGILWWNVLDGWPQFSDAVVDYYFAKKLAYHYIWRSQRPVAMLIGEAGAEKYLPVVISNDTLQSADVAYRIWNFASGETVAEGSFTAPANQNWQVARIRTYASAQQLYLMNWTVNEETFGNHYLTGTPPFSLAQYRTWLDAIAVLPRAFEPGEIAS